MERSVCGIASNPMLLVVSLHTGYCGEDNTDLAAVAVGADIDSLTRDLALENAQSYDSDGSYECMECGSSVGDTYCEDCDRDCEWIENDSVEGVAHLFDFADVGYLSATWKLVFEALQSIGVVQVDKNKLVVFKDKLEQATTYTSKDKPLLEQAIQQAYPCVPYAIVDSSMNAAEVDALVLESGKYLEEKITIQIRVEETTTSMYDMQVTRAQYQELRSENGSYWDRKHRLEDMFTSAEDSDLQLLQQHTDKLEVTITSGREQ